jgi:uncharacterized protein
MAEEEYRIAIVRESEYVTIRNATHASGLVVETSSRSRPLRGTSAGNQAQWSEAPDIQTDVRGQLMADATVNRPETWQARFYWWLDPRSWLRAILMLNDTPHSIALGTAIGVFIALTPTVGIQMLLVLLVGLITRPLFRFNQMAGLIAVYLSNPLTMIPIYWFNYRIGTLFSKETVTRAEFIRMFQYEGFSEWWRTITGLFVTVGTPLVVGSLIVAAVGGGITYPLMRLLLQRFHRFGPGPPPEAPVASVENS